MSLAPVAFEARGFRSFVPRSAANFKTTGAAPRRPEDPKHNGIPAVIALAVGKYQCYCIQKV